MQYRMRYTLWRVEANSLGEAKKKAVEILKTQAEHLVTVEPESPRKGLIRSLLFGP